MLLEYSTPLEEGYGMKRRTLHPDGKLFCNLQSNITKQSPTWCSECAFSLFPSALFVVVFVDLPITPKVSTKQRAELTRSENARECAYRRESDEIEPLTVHNRQLILAVSAYITPSRRVPISGPLNQIDTSS